MIDVYRRAARRCRTLNQFNALHIALENRITPLELMALRAAQGPWFHLRRLQQRGQRLLRKVGLSADDPMPPGELRDRWLREQLGLYRHSAKAQPEPYQRRRLSRHLRLYSAGGPRHDKNLLICFVGSSQRPFLPVPVFLQHVDAAANDVLMVGYPRGKGHRHGLPELGSTLEQTIDKLRDIADIHSYRHCAAIGTSGGGTPAILTALRLGLPVVLSAGGGSPSDPRWFAALGEEAGDRARHYAQAATVQPRVVLAFGIDQPKDVAAAQAFAACIPAELWPVSDGRLQVLHNVFSPLLKRRHLRGFLEAAMNVPSP